MASGKAGRPITDWSNGAWRLRKKPLRLPGSTARIAPERRDQLALPREMRERQPFVADLANRIVCAPWARGRELPGDAERLLAVLHCLAAGELPGRVCWCWPDRAPEPIDAEPGWLASWMRDRCCYKIEPTSPEAR